MTRIMGMDHIQERPGLHIAHLRQMVRLRRASGWLGIAAVVAALVMYQLHRDEPALFESAHGYAMQVVRKGMTDQAPGEHEAAIR